MRLNPIPPNALTTDGQHVYPVYLPQACLVAAVASSTAATATTGTQPDLAPAPVSPAAKKKKTATQPPLSPPAIARNDCVNSLKSIIDDKYRPYRVSLHRLVNGGNAAADVISLGLGGATTAAVGAATKTILAAMNTAVTGTKTALDADFLYKQSIEMVINQMDADRSAQYAIMQQAMNNEISGYTLAEGKNDLLRYYLDGTWDHAITALQVQTAANTAACQAAATSTKVASAKIRGGKAPNDQNLSSKAQGSGAGASGGTQPAGANCNQSQPATQ